MDSSAALMHAIRSSAVFLKVPAEADSILKTMAEPFVLGSQSIHDGFGRALVQVFRAYLQGKHVRSNQYMRI